MGRRGILADASHIDHRRKNDSLPGWPRAAVAYSPHISGAGMGRNRLTAPARRNHAAGTTHRSKK